MSVSLSPSTFSSFSSSPDDMFSNGSYTADTITLQHDKNDPTSPPKSVFIAYPVIDDGGDTGSIKVMEEEFGVLLLLHGYMLSNNFYSQLMCHIASHGYIVIAPQLYSIATTDASPDITAAAELSHWIKNGSLATTLHPHNIIPDLTRVSLSGHSRGAKAAFGLALQLITPNPLPLSSILAIDPVDGTLFGQTNPKILTHDGHAFDKLDTIPKMVIGSGLDVEKGSSCFSCTPTGMNYVNFWKECTKPPGCYFVVKGYGHLDVLDDKTEGVRGVMSYVMCRNGSSREPMRRFVGGAVVAHLKAYLDEDDGYLNAIRDGTVVIPVEFDAVDFRS